MLETCGHRYPKVRFGIITDKQSKPKSIIAFFVQGITTQPKGEAKVMVWYPISVPWCIINHWVSYCLTSP